MSAARYPRPIGVIAGLGPLAGANFYQHLVSQTEAGSDAGHPEVVLISDPKIPSRLDHLFGRGPSPAPALCSVARRLQDAGCRVIALTSVTTHAYYAQIAAAVDVPVVNALAAAVAALAQAGLARPALVTTWPARRLRLLEEPMLAAGITPCLPDGQTQDAIQRVVEQVKSTGATQELAATLAGLLARPWRAGADGMLIGCTDVSPLVPGLLRLGPWAQPPCQGPPPHPQPPGPATTLHDVAVILARAVLAQARRP
jgi:aspartate racemase